MSNEKLKFDYRLHGYIANSKECFKKLYNFKDEEFLTFDVKYNKTYPGRFYMTDASFNKWYEKVINFLRENKNINFDESYGETTEGILKEKRFGYSNNRLYSSSRMIFELLSNLDNAVKLIKSVTGKECNKKNIEVTFEKKIPIFDSKELEPAHLDALITFGNNVIAVEAKMCEIFTNHYPYLKTKYKKLLNRYDEEACSSKHGDMYDLSKTSLKTITTKSGFDMKQQICHMLALGNINNNLKGKNIYFINLLFDVRLLSGAKNCEDINLIKNKYDLYFHNENLFYNSGIQLVDKLLSKQSGKNFIKYCGVYNQFMKRYSE